MYLSNQFEVDLLSNATKASRAIVGTSPLSGLIGIEEVPGPLVPQDATDAEWQAFTKAQVTPVLHPIGTVPMLPKADGGAVDSNLIVYGTANVRVIGEECLRFILKMLIITKIPRLSRFKLAHI
jgi:choline dehydrogenase